MKLSEVFLRAAELIDSEFVKYPRIAVLHACEFGVNKYNETVPIMFDVFPCDGSEAEFDMMYQNKQPIVLGLLFCAEIAKEDE